MKTPTPASIQWAPSVSRRGRLGRIDLHLPLDELADHRVVRAFDVGGGPDRPDASLVEGGQGARVDLLGGQPAPLPERETHVLEHGQRVEEGAPLEDHPETLAHAIEGGPPEPRHVLPVDEDPPMVRADEAEHVAQEHRFPPARPPDDDHELARLDVEVDPTEDRLAPKALAESLDPDG